MRENGNHDGRIRYDGVFKALGDEHRLQILRLLARQELSAGEILESMDIVQSTLSHHMKVLTESGIVSARRSGKWTIYSVNAEVLKDTEKAMDDFLNTASAAGKSRIAEAAFEADQGTEAAQDAEAEQAAGEGMSPEEGRDVKAERTEKADRDTEADKAAYFFENKASGKEKKKGKKAKKSKKSGKK